MSSKTTNEAKARRDYYLSGLTSASLDIRKPAKPRPKKQRPQLRIVSNQPQTLTEALRQDARPRNFEPRAQAQGFFQDTRPGGGRSARGLSTSTKNLVIDHWAMRQNMRAATQDSPQARTILKRKNDSVVGNGLILDPTPDGNVLGIDEKELEIWANNVKSRFHLWAKSKKSDITGRNNFYQNTRFYGWQYGRDGDVFVRLHYSKNKDLTNPLQISFIDPNQIRGDEYTFSLGPVSQSDGILKDENGKESAYKVWLEDPQRPGSYKEQIIPANDKKTGRPLMLHGFNPEWAGQSRGIPELGHALQPFEDITTFNTTTAKKMISSSSFGFTVQNEQQTPGDMGLPSMTAGGVEQVVIQDTAPQTATPRTFSASTVVNDGVNEAALTEPGVYHLLSGETGDKLVQIKAEGPAETSGEFMDSQFRYLCASDSIPASIALMKFDKSHSASRGELGLFADVKQIIQDDIDADFIAIVVEAWMSEEIAKGTIRAPGWSDPSLKDAWLNHVLVGKPLPDVDPYKTMQSKQMALDMCFTDLDREAMLYNGSSGKANRAKMARQVPELTTDPFGLAAEKISTEPIEPEEPDPDDEDDTED